MFSYYKIRERQNPKVGISELFEFQVRRRPGPMAMLTNAGPMGYREFNHRDNRLSHYLDKRGVGCEVCVAIHLENIAELPICILSILKAGGAYFVLPADSSPERLRQLIDMGAPKLILTDNDAIDDPRRIDLREIASDLEKESQRNLRKTVHPESLACLGHRVLEDGSVIGVDLSNMSLMNLIMSLRVEPGFFPGEFMLSILPAPSETFCMDLYIPFACGGCLVFANKDSLSEALGKLPGKSKVYVVYANKENREALKETRAVCEELKIWQKEWLVTESSLAGFEAGETEIWRLFGFPETSVWFAMELGMGNRNLLPSRLARNTNVYVLGESCAFAPPGTTGRLYVSGHNLARSYRFLPRLTAERFVPDPHSDKPGSRMFDTGRRARYVEKGAVELLPPA